MPAVNIAKYLLRRWGYFNRFLHLGWFRLVVADDSLEWAYLEDRAFLTTNSECHRTEGHGSTPQKFHHTAA